MNELAPYIVMAIFFIYIFAMQLTHNKTVKALKQELECWKRKSIINEQFLFSIGDLIPEEERETKIIDRDKEPSILKRIWWNVEDALYK